MMTVGQAWKGRYRLIVRCNWGRRLGMKTIRECLGSAELDLETLAWAKGNEFPIERLKDRRLRCPRCRSLRVRLQLVAPAETAALRRRIS
jgi:hypothetical protein